MTAKRPIDVITGLRNTRRSMGDGTLQGRSRVATPYQRGQASQAPASRVVVPTTMASGAAIVHHVTATAEASQSIAAGGATVQWGSLASSPTERKGFDSFASDIAAGSVGDIPCDLTGDAWVAVRLPFTADASGTCTVSRIRSASVETIIQATGTGPKIVGGKWFHIDSGDSVRVELDLDADATLDDSNSDELPQVELEVFGTPKQAAEWTKVADVTAQGIYNDGSSWWVTEGNNSYRVVEYDTSWTQLSTFDATRAEFNGFRHTGGITMLGGNLWITGHDGESGAENDSAIEYETDGTEVSFFHIDNISNDGIVSDGTDLWVMRRHSDEVARFDTAGTVQETVALPGDRYGLDLYDGKFVMTTPDQTVEVRALDGTLERTVTGLTFAASGVWVDDDGTVYVSDATEGVWRWDGGKL